MLRPPDAPRNTVRRAVRTGAAIPRTLLALGILAVAAAVQAGCSGCYVNSTPTPSQRLQAALQRAEARKQAEARARNSVNALPPCPALNAPVVPGTLPANGGHRVILSWTASPPADPKHSAAVGYCIYRLTSGAPNSALLNPIPFAGTNCIDDTVANGQRYSYVVRAIAGNGKTSTTSNSAPVSIPAQGQSISPPAAPFCRGAPALR